ncbi:LOW QUALITY PROTEIN: hypothetical protein V1477_006381 [Vespula maculifrons]|uniref:Uncharacterized protein n=1 Tax=Vespula maculifrons TaxID=7453 RepID=A0ABD2CK98_VESMC
MARRALSNDPGLVLLGAIVPEKKIVKKNFCSFVLFKLSAPIGPIWTKKIWSQRARRVLSNDQGSVLLDTIVSEKKIVKEKFFFPLFPLNRYNSAPIGPICTQKDGRRVRDEPFQTDPENVFFFVPFKPLLLCSYWSALYAKNMCVEDATTSFKRPRSCSRRCYSFGEKKLLRNNFFFLCSL